jgi:hypothetical protein
VIAPAAGDLQIAGRETFATKAESLHQSTRGFIAWLDVSLYTMKMKAAENPS